MKKITRIFFIISLVCFSFFYTEKVMNLLNSKDPLMVKLNNIKKDYEVLKAIYGHFSLFLFRRSASSGFTASDSGKCIWTGVYASSTYDRSIKTASGKGGICFFDRDYAGYVHSGSSRSD